MVEAGASERRKSNGNDFSRALGDCRQTCLVLLNSKAIAFEYNRCTLKPSPTNERG